MKPTELETATAAIAEFDRVLVETNALDDDTLGQQGIETLKRFFLAGFAYARTIDTPNQEKAPESPVTRKPGQSKPWYPRKDGQPVKVTHPDEPASDKQYQFIKKLCSADLTKARAIMSREEYDKVYSDIGTFTKGQASDLIDRLVNAGIRPRRNK